MTLRAPDGSVRFGEFDLNPAAYVLRRTGERIRLERIPMEVLILLVQSAGRLVGREEIQTLLWEPDVFVERDAAINTAVRKIREALADDASEPRFIETVVGKGYRFIARIDRPARLPSLLDGETDAAGVPQRTGAPFPACQMIRAGQQFILRQGKNLLGRDPEATVYIDHPSVSRRHARVSIEGVRAVLEDLDSRNGTFLNGQRVDAPTELADGAVVGLGPVTVTFLVLTRPASTQPMGGFNAPPARQR